MDEFESQKNNRRIDRDFACSSIRRFANCALKTITLAREDFVLFLGRFVVALRVRLRLEQVQIGRFALDEFAGDLSANLISILTNRRSAGWLH